MKLAISALLILGSLSISATEFTLECVNLQIILNDSTLLTTVKTSQDESLTSYSSVFKRKTTNQVIETYRSTNGITITRPAEKIFIFSQTKTDGTVIVPNTQCRLISRE